jgi:hypothetical protein
MANFVALWLQTGANAADLDGEADDVDFEDYAIFSGYYRTVSLTLAAVFQCLILNPNPYDCTTTQTPNSV